MFTEVFVQFTRMDAAHTCPEPWSHVNKSAKILSVKVCHLTQFAFFWSFSAQYGMIQWNVTNLGNLFMSLYLPSFSTSQFCLIQCDLRRYVWSSLLEMRNQHKAVMMYKIVHGLAPSYMADMFPSQKGSQTYNLRNYSLNLEIPNVRTKLYRNSFAFTGAKIWNDLPDDLKNKPYLNAFKKRIKHINFCIDNN